MTARIAIVHPSPLLAEALGTALVRRGVGEIATYLASADPGTVASTVSAARVDVVIIATDVGDQAVCDVAETVTGSCLRAAVIIVGDVDAPDLVLRALDAGASALVGADEPLDRVAEAVTRVADGDVMVPAWALAPLLRRLIVRRRAANAALERFVSLTAREREILRRLFEGEDEAGIAAGLFISPATARTHIRNVLRKLGVHSRLEAVALAGEHGWFSLLAEVGT